jgi:hypothetical protein
MAAVNMRERRFGHRCESREKEAKKKKPMFLTRLLTIYITSTRWRGFCHHHDTAEKDDEEEMEKS